MGSVTIEYQLFMCLCWYLNYALLKSINVYCEVGTESSRIVQMNCLLGTRRTLLEEGRLRDWWWTKWSWNMFPPPRALQFSAVSRDGSVGKATHCGLDSPGIESRWGARFSTPMQTGPGAYPASCTMDTGCLSRG
jgi:hypothetical protein